MQKELLHFDPLSTLSEFLCVLGIYDVPGMGLGDEVKEESEKVGLTLNIQKTKIMKSSLMYGK